MRGLLGVVATLLGLVALADFSTAAALLAIDYGTDSFKASLVKPGVPFDVLINKDSKRKTPSLVTMRGDDRSFGGEAANLATRFPKDTFSAVKLLLGHSTNHPQAILHKSLFGSAPITTERGTPAVTSSKGSFPVEEVLAMQLTYAKELAEELAKESVRDTVVTVPGWFTQSERQAVLDAVELAGLRPLGLVNDGTAAAVNYAMSRNFPAEQSYHLLYDLGSGSLRTTLVSLKSALLPDPLSLAAKPELKNVTSLTVHGFGFDTSVGGFVFDSLVRDLLRADFERSTGKQVAQDARAMAKLLKEASRVKQVEGLIDDTDLRALVSREQFESRASELVPRFTKPIQDAFVGTNLTLDNVESVILIGGSTRVPMVEAAIRAVVGEDKIAKNLNADEAAVMGAALYGAGISRGFRTKDIRVQDITPFGIDVSYEADQAAENAEPRTINTHLFPAFAKTGIKKTMTFKKTSDFPIRFSYRKDQLSCPLLQEGVQQMTKGLRASAEMSASLQLFETKISGLAAAFTNMTDEAIANATIKVTIDLNESGMVSIQKAVAVLREQDEGTETPSLNEKLKGLLSKFGGGSKGDGTEKTKGDKASDADSPVVENPFADLNDTESDATRAKLEELLRASVPANSTVRLSLDTVAVDHKPMSMDDKMASRKSLREIKQAETRKLAREEARNVLEAYIYRVRDLLEDTAFMGASLESERKTISEKAALANEWLWEEADKAPTKDLKDRKLDLEKLVKHITTRTGEASQRPRVIDAFKAVLLGTDGFLASAKENNTASEKRNETPKYTNEELSALAKIKSDAAEWFAATFKKQASLKPHDDPILRVADLEKKSKELEVEVVRLTKKKMPKRPRATTSSAATSSSSSSTTAEPAAETTETARKKDEL